MRLGVLDVGSNTLHLLVVDAHQGARPIPAFSHKAELHFGEHLDGENRLTHECALQLLGFVEEALQIAEDKGVHETLAFATSAVREAANGDEVLRRIEEQTGVSIRVLPGPDESRLTFLAARRWYGWSAGRLLMLDIGGGSLEIAAGHDEDPDVAISLPLGAGRLTREWLPGDPPSADDVRRLRKHVRAEIAAQRGVGAAGGPAQPRGRHLQDLPPAGPDRRGRAVQRRPVRPADAAALDVTEIAERLARLTVAERAELPGVSAGRAPQLAAGAIVADAAMDLFDLNELEICPGRCARA